MRIRVWEIKDNPKYDPNDEYDDKEIQDHICSYEGCMPVVGQSFWFELYDDKDFPLTEYRIEQVDISVSGTKYNTTTHLQIYVRKAISQ